MSKYNYEELKKKASAITATKEDRMNLWNWFENYGNQYWNGECYNADDFLLYPVYDFTAEDENYDIVDCEIH